MRKLLAMLAAAAMFAATVPAYVRACENPPNAKGSYETGLDHRNVHADAKTGNDPKTDAKMDAISRIDTDNDTARDAHAKLPPGWQQGGDWSSSSSTSTTTTTTTTTAPVVMRPGY